MYYMTPLEQQEMDNDAYDPTDGTVYVMHPKSVSDYWIAMHELGHAADHDMNHTTDYDTVNRESLAWVWAFKNSKFPPDDEVLNSIVYSVNSYITGFEEVERETAQDKTIVDQPDPPPGLVELQGLVKAASVEKR
jgi:hypothetical protein